MARGLGALALAAVGRTARAATQGDDIRFGYAAITWGGNDRQAIDDIAAVGFRGIQLRASAAANRAYLEEQLGFQVR